MQSRTPNWLFGTNFNFGTDSVFVLKHNDSGDVLPPVSSYIITESVGTNYVLTEDGNRTITE